tara:strand:- start:2615 stop:3157 length:543 start_codon:yes stop_codon:yes gene_type:complete
MIQIEQTPNPDSLKFLSQKNLSKVGTEEFKKSNLSNIKIPFIRELLSFSGVELILISDNFLTVKKEKDASWDSLKPMIISHLNDYFEKTEDPILTDNKKEKKTDENETISKIKDVLDTKIRPAVARDGGDIKFKSFDNGVVRVELQGACSGCPSSIMTLKQGVQNLLKHYVKEVNSVEAI